jgi:phage shock protein C
MGTAMQQTDSRFHRGSDRILGGVCSGLAAEFHVDPLWVRLGFVLLAFAQGVGIALYVVLWFLMPEPATGAAPRRSGLDSMLADLRRLWDEVRGQLGGTTNVQTSSLATVTPTPADTAQVPPPVEARRRDQSLLLGLILVAIGGIALANNAGYVTWDVLWPAILIAIGVLLLVRSVNRGR